MTLTATERARLRALWRQLAQAARSLDAGAVKAVSSDLLGLASPLDDKSEAFVLFAFGRLAFAYGRAAAGLRTQMAPALAALAELAGDLLDATDPAAARAAPTLPFRADLDG